MAGDRWLSFLVAQCGGLTVDLRKDWRQTATEKSSVQSHEWSFADYPSKNWSFPDAVVQGRLSCRCTRRR